MKLKTGVVGIVMLIGSLSLLFPSCGSKGNKIEIKRLDVMTDAVISGDSVITDSIIDNFSDGYDAWFAITGKRNRDMEANIREYGYGDAFTIFYPDVCKRLGSLDSVETVLGRTGMILSGYDIYGVVTPYNQSIMVADSVILVGLNHYLGADYEGYAAFDEYKRRLKTKTRMPYDVVEAAIRAKYPPAEFLNTVSRMAYEGAISLAVAESLGGMATDVIGYDSRSAAWVKEYESDIWDALVRRDLLFSTDRMVADRLVGMAPSTTLIHPDAPGMIGRYVGYRIVESYLKSHPEMTSVSFLQSQIYNSSELLIEARYQGR